MSVVHDFFNLTGNEISDTKSINKPQLGNIFSGRGAAIGAVGGSMQTGVAGYVCQVTLWLPMPTQTTSWTESGNMNRRKRKE